MIDKYPVFSFGLNLYFVIWLYKNKYIQTQYVTLTNYCNHHFVFSIVDRSFTENLLFFKGKGPSIFHMLTIKSTIHHKVLQNPMTTFWKQTQKAMAYAWLNPIPMFVCLLTNDNKYHLINQQSCFHLQNIKVQLSTCIAF